MNLTIIDCIRAHEVVSEQSVRGTIDIPTAMHLYGAIKDKERELFAIQEWQMAQQTLPAPVVLTRVDLPSPIEASHTPLAIEPPQKQRHLMVRTSRR